MKPINNYGLSDSLIDTVRKAVKEAKLHSNQQKLDVHEPEKDELTSQDFKKLRAGKKVKDGIDTKPKLKEEEEQIDELSVHKMLKYTDAANKNREVLNKKWDTGTATEREKNKVLGHEMGADRAAARIKAKTGKNPHEIGKLSRIKYAITREEEQMDEAPLRAVNALVGYPKLNKKVAAKGTPGSEDERNKAAAGLKRDRSGLGRRAYTGDQHYDVRREEVEQMDESLDSIAKKHGMQYTKTYYGAGMKHPTKGEISINRYGEWHHKGTNKTGDSENDFSSLDKHLSTVKEEEQMDEVKLADLPRRKVVGKSYGADYVDPEGADDADDMKKAEPKRKSGPQGTMKRRFIKDKSKLRMQFK